MPRIALALCLTYLAVGLAGRTWLQLRRTGDHGFRGISGRPGSIQWWGGVLVAAGSLVVVAGPAAEVLGVVESLHIPYPSPVNVAGLILAVSGIVVTVTAQLQMGASWRIGVDEAERTSLITGGLFSWVRNPIFTGLLLMAAGVLLLAPNVLSAAGLATLVAGLEIHVRRVEEPYLAQAHGERYLSYARAVGRFVPRLGRLT